MQRETIQGFRLSPQQRRIWRLQCEQQIVPYRVQIAVLLEGPLDSIALERALQQVVSRQEILRTTFHSWLGMSMPLQVIESGGGNITLNRIRDLSHLPPREQEVQLDVLFDEMLQWPFDL